MCSFNEYIALDFLVMLNSNKKNNLESGLNHWLFQKVTAVLLIPITIWVLLKLPKFIQLSFSDKLSWINSSLNLYLVALFFIISAFHFKLGLTVIIEDYIHNSIVKKYYQLQKLGINNIFIYKIKNEKHHLIKKINFNE